MGVINQLITGGAHPVTHERKKNMKTTEVLVSRLRRNYNHFTHKCAGALLSSMDRFPEQTHQLPILIPSPATKHPRQKLWWIQGMKRQIGTPSCSGESGGWD